MKVRLAAAAALVAVLVAGGVVRVEFWSSAGAGGGGALAEAVSLRDAAAAPALDAAAADLYALVARADARGSAAGAAVLRRGVPPLASTIEADLGSARRRVAAAAVATAAGRACRRVLLDLLVRRRWLYTALRAGVEDDPDAWDAVDRFAAGSQALERWWAGRVRACAAAGGEPDRAAVEQALAAL